MDNKKINLLVIIPPAWRVVGTIFEIGPLLDTIKDALDQCVNTYDVVSSLDEYKALPEEKRLSYEVIAPQIGPIAPAIITDQVTNNKNLKWVQSLGAGIDGFVAIDAFRESDVVLTNVKGAFSEVLGEFIALGVLYHAKHVERFMKRKE